MVIYEYVHYLKVVIFWLNSKGYPIFLDVEGNVPEKDKFLLLTFS